MYQGYFTVHDSLGPRKSCTVRYPGNVNVVICKYNQARLPKWIKRIRSQFVKTIQTLKKLFTYDN